MMDAPGEDGRSLGGVSKWMRRSDRPDFMDMCASSPPADGFFYPNNPRVTQAEQKTQNECTQRESGVEIIGSQNKPYNQAFRSESEQNISCMKDGQSGFFKTFGPTGYPSAGDLTASTANSRSILNMDSKELEKWATKNITASGERAHASDDSAPTPIDHLLQYRRIGNPAITRTTMESGSVSMRYVDRHATPDVTPSSTPSITPICSPQVPRKTGNPFFSGEMNPPKNDGGSWLFRAGPKASDNMLYEAKVEIQPSVGGPGTKSIRYVPRPSKLRELNFLSPTSM